MCGSWFVAIGCFTNFFFYFCELVDKAMDSKNKN